ncbi:MAG: NUDIX hydrolase [Propioniciclava sp.]
MSSGPRPGTGLEKLVAGLETGSVPLSARRRQAAVMIPLFPLAGAAAGHGLVLVEKSADLRSYAGQIAFPGGGVDAGDADVPAAARREAAEEVGITPEEIDVLGLLPPVNAVTGHHVSPVVGLWRSPRPLAPVDTVEVAAVHTVTLAQLVEPTHRWTWKHRLGFTGPAFVIGELFIWGLTAHLINDLLERGGWTRPWERDRVTAIPERFDGAARQL